LGQAEFVGDVHVPVQIYADMWVYIPMPDANARAHTSNRTYSDDGGMFSHKHHVGHVSRLSVTATFIDIATVEAMLSFFYIVRLQMLGQQSARHVWQFYYDGKQC